MARSPQSCWYCDRATQLNPGSVAARSVLEPFAQRTETAREAFRKRTPGGPQPIRSSRPSGAAESRIERETGCGGRLRQVTDDEPISYAALPVGTPVFADSGAQIGTVAHVLQIPDLDVFDGIVVATDGGLRFVDRDQVDSITTSAVRTTVTPGQAANLPAPDGPPVYSVDAFQDEGHELTARLGRLFRRGHWTRESD